jgi:ligand-binding SRPBCC domain-containing protein
MAQSFKTEQWVPYPVELVFSFFANPANLPRLMPRGMEARVEHVRIQPAPPRPVAADPAHRHGGEAAGVGSEIQISFLPASWVPRRVTWLARITEFEWNSHFCDEQVRGPFANFHHSHIVIAEARDGLEGTRVRDEIEFALPMGMLGQAGESMVKKSLTKAFAYRQKRLAEVLAAMVQEMGKRK